MQLKKDVITKLKKLKEMHPLAKPNARPPRLRETAPTYLFTPTKRMFPNTIAEDLPPHGENHTESHAGIIKSASRKRKNKKLASI